jgi:pseudouridine synthase
MSIPLQKFIADSGHCSRRQAEQLIRAGKVRVNGRLAELGMRASAADRVEIDGIALRGKSKPVYLAINKPVGYTCTSRKFPGEKNIFELIDSRERLFCVGRLDKESQGLVLLTNDGALTERLTHPRFRHWKKYEVTVQSVKDPAEAVRKLRSGVTITDERKDDDFQAKALAARYLADNKFELTISEGKKRQVRKMFGALGLRVTGLVRVEFAGIKLGKLKTGEGRPLVKKEVSGLLKF